MKMSKKTLLKKLLPVAVVGAGLAVAGSAVAAYVPTAYFNIQKLQASAGVLTVYGGGDVDPAGCSFSAVNGAVAKAGLPEQEYEVMNKVLMAALLADRQVTLYIESDATDSQACRWGLPTYYKVSIR